MSTQRLLGLPPVSLELKPILPFLQRAEELKKQDPVIAYWCAYYAAQVGISLKARNSASRDILLGLLDVLEKLKAQLGDHDAVEIEAVSAAYVENFALKIFNSADEEDRRGIATRTTAKKFLAASNFLEILKVFPKAEVAELNEEKIRYAKWKAADIAKAFREGRKPAAGPVVAQEPTLELVEDNDPFVQQIPPPAHIDLTDAMSSNFHNLARLDEGDVPQKSWSTVATPGAGLEETSPFPSTHSLISGSHSETLHANHNQTQGASGTAHGSTPKNAWVSEEMEDTITPPSPPYSNDADHPGVKESIEGKKTVHFAPSAVDVSPTSLPKAPSPMEIYRGPPSIYAPQSTPSPSISPIGVSPSRTHHVHPPQPSSYPPPRDMNTSIPPPQLPNYPYPSIPATSPSATVPAPPPVSALSKPEELTPSVIAKAQKHCRFAISALDYEDAEQARKELRAALAILGGL